MPELPFTVGNCGGDGGGGDDDETGDDGGRVVEDKYRTEFRPNKALRDCEWKTVGEFDLGIRLNETDGDGALQALRLFSKFVSFVSNSG